VAGSFSQQISEQNAQQQQSRVSRTQRKQAEQEEGVARFKFESAKKEAERLRTEEFIDKDVVKTEQYNIYRPKNISARDWDRMRQRDKDAYMKQYQSGRGVEYYASKGYVVVHSVGTRDVTERDQFTFEDYKTEYAKLSPDIQQFFSSPESITAEQNRLKEVEKTNVTAKLSQWQEDLQYKQNRLKDEEERWRNQSSSYRKNENNRKRYDERRRDYEWDIEEYQDKIRILQQEQGKIDQGYKAGDLINYAGDKADYYRQRSEGNYNAQQTYLTQLNQGQLDADLVKLGFAQGEKPKYQDFVKSVEKFNKDVAYTNQLRNWAGKVGYENLPTFAKEKILSGGSNTKEIPVFDNKGNLVAVKSEKLGKTVPIVEYNAYASEQQKKYDKLSATDTTLKLGEKVETKNYATMSDGTNFQKLTKEQQRLNEYYADQSVIQKGFNWVKGVFGLDKKTEETAPKLTTETKILNPMSSGTAITEVKLDKKSQLYVDEFTKFNTKADTLSNEIFKDYETQIEKLSADEITPEKISAIKLSQQEKFNTGIAGISDDFSTTYEAGLKKINRENSIKSASLFGLGGVVKFYQGLEDKDLARQQKKYDFKLNSFADPRFNGKGTLMYEGAGEWKEGKKAKELFGGQDQVTKDALRDFSFYRDLGVPKWLARNWAGNTEFSKGTIQGTYKAVYENPRTIGFKTTAFATAVAGATVLTTYSSGAGAVAGSSILKWGSAGLTGIWAGSVVVRTSAGSTTYERGLILGDIGGKEILPLLAGGYVGRKIGTKGVQWYEDYKTFKQSPEYISATKRVRMEVLRGDQNFPTEKTSKHLSEFEKAKYSLLTDEKGSKLKVTRKFKIVDETLTFKSNKKFVSMEQRSQYNARQLFDMDKQIKIPSTKPFTVDFNKGVIKFNKAMGYTQAEKMTMLKSYFGSGYSTGIKGSIFRLTKYVKGDKFNKFDVSAGSHATQVGRFVKTGERYIASAGSSEVPAQYFSSEDSLYFALGKGTKSSLYGGSLFGSAVAKPYVEAYRSKGFVKIPKNYKPSMTKAEVVEYLKQYAPNYPLKTILRAKGSYWKETAFMIERGRTGELIVIGRKSEIEAGKLFGSVAERTAQKPFYTRVATNDFYKSLEGINRMGRIEQISRVQAFKVKDILSPSTLKTKILQRFAPSDKQFLINLKGRSVGSFAPMKKIGRVIPIERYKAIPETQLEREQHFTTIEKIKKLIRSQGGSKTFQKVSVQAIEEQKLTRALKQINEENLFSSSQKMPKSSLTYGEEYASLISFPKSSKTRTPSYSATSSSSLKSAISSLLSSGSSMKSSKSSSGSSKSSPSYSSASYSYDYWSGSSFASSSSSSSTRSYFSKPRLSKSEKLKEQLRRKRKITPEIEALFPDFTARALGIAPKRVGSVKEALREISKLRTGFEVRTGARVKGYSPIDEKSLLRGVMK
jgi:hypothetical protein